MAFHWIFDAGLLSVPPACPVPLLPPRRATAPRPFPIPPICPLSVMEASLAQGDLVSSSLSSPLVQSSGFRSFQNSFANAVEEKASAPNGYPNPRNSALRLVITLWTAWNCLMLPPVSRTQVPDRSRDSRYQRVPPGYWKSAPGPHTCARSVHERPLSLLACVASGHSRHRPDGLDIGGPDRGGDARSDLQLPQMPVEEDPPVQDAPLRQAVPGVG